MSKAIVKICSECNNNCVFCHTKPKKDKLGSLENTLEKIKLLKNKGVDTIYLSGGECLINPEFYLIVDEILKQKLKFGLITNSRMLSSKELIATLVSKGLVYVHTSLHGPKDIHDKLTMVPNSFDQTIAGIINIIDSGIELDVNCVVVKQNLPYLSDVAQILTKVGAPSIRYSFVEPLSSKDEYIPRIKDVAEKIKFLIESSNIDVFFDSLPLCLTKDFETHRFNLLTKGIEYISEYYEQGVFKADYGDKMKPHKCDTCVKKDICEGVYSLYLDIYGDDELVPF